MVALGIVLLATVAALAQIPNEPRDILGNEFDQHGRPTGRQLLYHGTLRPDGRIAVTPGSVAREPMPDQPIGATGQSASKSLPPGATLDSSGVPNYGVRTENLVAPGREKITTTGPLGRQFERDMKRGDNTDHLGIPDFRSKPNLVIIGSEEHRKQVERDLKASPLKEAAVRWNVQCYDPGELAVEGIGLWGTGKPTIHLLGPTRADGKGDYWFPFEEYPGPDVLARTLDHYEAVRKKDPSFDPFKGRTKSGETRQYYDASPTTIIIVVFAAVVAMILLLIPSRSEGTIV